MTPQQAIIKLRLRLNKSHSSDYDNIPDWIAVEAIRKAYFQIVRRSIIGLNRTQEGDEETRVKVDDLQILLTNKKVGGTNKKDYFESEILPEDYLYYKGIEILGSDTNCKNKRIYSQLVEEANVQRYLSDWSIQPDFKWRITFHTLSGNKLKIYRNSEFTISNVSLSYYRLPKAFDIHGYEHEDGTASSNVDLEFKNDLAEIVLDEAANIIAGDLELISQYQTTKTNVDIND